MPEALRKDGAGQRQRILVVSERYWPEGSGGELATHLITKLLADEFDITVVTGTKEPERAEGVRYIYEPALSAKSKHVLWLNTTRLAKSTAFRKLVERADVVYVPRFAFPVIPLAKRLGKKVVVHLHGYIPISYTAVVLAPYEKHKRRIHRENVALECRRGAAQCAAAGLTAWLMPKLAERWISMADAVICVSKRQAQIISEAAPQLRNKIAVVYNPPPPMPPLEKRPSETPTLLYVGGDSYLKGFPIALWALSRLRHNYKAYVTGHVSAKWANLVNKLGGKVTLLGRVPYSDVLKLHAQAWTLLFPSIWEEPLPYAVVEALMAGTIPIAFAVGGVSEIVEGTIAERFLCNPGDVKCFIQRLEAITTSTPSDITEIGLKIRELLLSRFNNELLREKITKIFCT